MKTTILIFSLLIASILSAQDNKKNTEASKFQNKLNKEFSSNEDSPLTEEDLESFTKLDFFAIDTSFRVTAKLKFHKDSKPFKMTTTTDRLPVYKLYATASFTLKGKLFQLEIYQNEKLTLSPEYEDHLFLPFTDNTNGETSYGGGRYIDLNVPESDQLIIDFNQAYNPYCAYNHKYSCPIPPEVNHLDTEVKAGVMAYNKQGSN
jgi:uncharacterized protein (DUF1684 family)